MSAAPPLPPPPSGPPAHTNGYDGSHSRAGSNASAGPNAGGERRFEHIQDLRAKALQGLTKDTSIHSLLQTADLALKQSQNLLDFRRPDLAYVEYLRASEIVVHLVPEHRDHFDLTHDQDAERLAWTLARKINQKSDQFAKIKDIIINNNRRSGVQPNVAGNNALTGQSSEAAREKDFHAPAPAQTALSGVEDSNSPQLSAPPPKYKPSVSPKPQALHGKAIPHGLPANGVTTSAGGDTLSDRFAKLRMMPGSIDTSRRPDSRSSMHSSPVTMPSISDYTGRESFDSLTRASSISSNSGSTSGRHPYGAGLPIPPAKLPLDTSFAAEMPQAPAVAYSPARNMQTNGGSFDPPRHSARSIVGTGGRQNSIASSASSHAPNSRNSSDGYFPAASTSHAAPMPGPPPRRKSINVPKETRISAERLFDYVKMFNILLIDVRARGDFDQGHIWAPSVMCVEPTVLRENMSADELADRLVLSPDNEQEMWMKRNAYDLVVYYDYDTQSENYIQRPSSDRDRALRYLYDALYEFNHDKPLQRPPILLMGGISAWADLVGNQALAASNTAAKVKGARPIQRVPVANGGSRLHVPKRRLRDYNPLDSEEERSWMERARVESVVVDQKPPLDEEDESAQVEDDSEAGQEAIKEFLERFPEAGSLDKQANGRRPPSRPPPEPPKIPLYPTAPPPSQFPSVPARPKPAAPRMSYSGVNERSVSQTTPNRSQQLAPYIPPKYLSVNLRLPRTGLVNFGVTCYMNATLQALSATTPLSIFFMDDKFRSIVQRENWKGSKGVLPELYSNLIRSLWKGDVQAIKPSTFRTFCGRLNREWSIDRQQDAKEFFDFLVDCLHEDLNGMWARTPLRALTEAEEAKRERLPKLMVAKTEWSRYTHREQSFLTSLFGGQHASRLRCTTCGFTSTTYEAFYSISVEIPRSGHATLADCLRSYCQEEMLSGDEVWKCPHCKKEREATKQITITRAPQFLMVHFKRFSAGRGESARKVRTPIDFPLHDLDLEPYMLPRPSAEEAQAIAREFGAEQLKTEACMTAPFLYDAYAVIRHIGTTLSSGHYTCAAMDRARRTWRMFNDTRVVDFEPASLRPALCLQNEEAYMVAYQRTPAEAQAVDWGF